MRTGIQEGEGSEVVSGGGGVGNARMGKVGIKCFLSGVACS